MTLCFVCAFFDDFDVFVEQEATCSFELGRCVVLIRQAGSKRKARSIQFLQRSRSSEVTVGSPQIIRPVSPRPQVTDGFKAGVLVLTNLKLTAGGLTQSCGWAPAGAAGAQGGKVKPVLTKVLQTSSNLIAMASNLVANALDKSQPKSCVETRELGICRDKNRY